MLGKYLGIDIIEDSMTAVLVKSGLQEHRIIACTAISIEKAGGPEAALAVLLERMDSVGADCICAIPSDHVSYRNLSLPFKDTKKIRQIIAFELETLLPFPIDDLLVDFTVTGRSNDQTDILAAAVSRSFLSEFLAFFERYGIIPEILEIRNVPVVLWMLKQTMTPDNGLFLDIDSKGATIILFLERRIVLIRKVPFNGEIIQQKIKENDGIPSSPDQESESVEAVFKSLCKTIQNTLMAFVDQTDEVRRPEKVFVTGSAVFYPGTVEFLGRFLELPAKEINLCRDPRIQIDAKLISSWKPALMDNALALALRDSGKGAGFNFRREEFEVTKRLLQFKKEFRAGLFFLLVLLALMITSLGVDYYSLKKRYQVLDKKVTGIFIDTFPDIKRVVDPVQQMQEKVNEIRRTAGSFSGTGDDRKVLDLLGDISKRIPKTLKIKVTRMIIDQDGVQIKGTTDTFNTVDTIKKGLESSVYFTNVAISSANLDRSGKGVRFEIRSQLGQ